MKQGVSTHRSWTTCFHFWTPPSWLQCAAPHLDETVNQSPDLHALTAALAPDWRVFEDDCAAVRQRPALSLPTDSGVFIYGAGRFGRDVAAALQDQGQGVLGFIDRRSSGAPVDGLASWTLPQVASRLSGQTVWVAVFNREAPLLGIAQQLLAAGARQVCMPWDFYPLVAAKLGWRYWLSGPEEILQNLDAIGRTYQRLADSTSQQRLVDVCRFRLGLQLAYSQFVDPQPQYFNELTLPRPDQPVRYVDAGAFNGDTYLALKSQARVDEAWLFEPDPQNYRLLVQASKVRRSFMRFRWLCRMATTRWPSPSVGARQLPFRPSTARRPTASPPARWMMSLATPR
jgi:hypothetical protein